MLDGDQCDRWRVDVIAVGGLRISFARTGQGSAVVLLGGFVGGAEATWRHQIDTLSTDRTVVAWDAPGSGGSADPQDSFRLPDYADCLAEVIAVLNLESPVIVGLSFGGALALEFFRRHRNQVSGLVLAGAYAGWAGSLPPDSVQARLRMSLEASRLPPSEFASALLPSMFSINAAADRVAEFAADVASSFHPSGFRAMARASAEADLRDVLPTVDVPTLILHGDQDVRAPRAVADALHAAIPKSSLTVLADVGHVSCVEAPERFTAEVQAFLNR